MTAMTDAVPMARALTVPTARVLQVPVARASTVLPDNLSGTDIERAHP